MATPRTTPPPPPAAAATAATADRLGRRERYSIEFRSMIDKEAANDESKSANGSQLWETMRSHVLNTTFRYTTWADPMVEFEWDMHDLWHISMQAARITDADDAAQDRLVSQLLYARSLGTLHRTTTTAGATAEEAIIPDGSRIWTDLPFLVQDMREAWEHKCMDLSPSHRRNLAAFTARLTALGVGGDAAGLSDCALWLLRAALETSRPLLTQADRDGPAGTSVASLLPACSAWFQYAGHRLLALCVTNHVSDPRYAAPGELAHAANISQPGFSVARWQFWRRRFKELSRCADDPVVAQHGRRGFGWMIGMGRQIGYTIPGEANYAAKVHEALWAEMARTGKRCVTSDEVVIDLDWAD